MDKNTLKTPNASQVLMTELVLPNDTNLLGNLLGGQLMHWMDIAGALAATRHARHMVVTVSVDQLQFRHPIKQGDLVEITARVIWVGNTSMVVKVKAVKEQLLTGEQVCTNEAYFTFVALDAHEKPAKVPGLVLETLADKQAFESVQMKKYIQ